MIYAIIRNANYKKGRIIGTTNIVFLSVIHKLDTKSGKVINKIACTEYWKRKDSYRILQDNF